MQKLHDEPSTRNPRPRIDVSRLPLHDVVDQAITLIREAGRIGFRHGGGVAFGEFTGGTPPAELADFDVELSRVACWAAGDKLIWPPERVVAAVAAHCRRAELELRHREMYPENYAVGGAA